MTDHEIVILKNAVKSHRVIWNPDEKTARVVRSVGKAPTIKGDEPEPSEVAFFSHNDYAALHNCSLKEFVKAYRIEESEDGKCSKYDNRFASLEL